MAAWGALFEAPLARNLVAVPRAGRRATRTDVVYCMIDVSVKVVVLLKCCGRLGCE